MSRRRKRADAGGRTVVREMRVARLLPILLSVPLLAGALAVSSPALAASPTHFCGRFKIGGFPVSNVRVRNVTCAKAKRLLVHFHNTDRGLSCSEFFSDTAPLRIRCKGRVAVADPGRGGSGRRFVVAVIAFSLPDCPPSADCES
jgi:hypothetical protein